MATITIKIAPDLKEIQTIDEGTLQVSFRGITITYTDNTGILSEDYRKRVLQAAIAMASRPYHIVNNITGLYEQMNISAPILTFEKYNE